MVLLTRRLARSGQERERLLQAAVHASDAERLRIARDLHDGVVQDLAGSSFALSTISSRAGVPDGARGRARGSEPRRSARACARCGRCWWRSTRPTCTPRDSLPRSTDLVAPVAAAGIHVDLDVSGDEGASETAVSLAWRVAQESVRNVARHASASRVSVTIHREGDSLCWRWSTTARASTRVHPSRRTISGCVASTAWSATPAARWSSTSAVGKGTTVRAGGARMIRVVIADDHAVVRRGLSGLIDKRPTSTVVGVATDGQTGGRAGRASTGPTSC